jgi:aldose 1-epimerase
LLTIASGHSVCTLLPRAGGSIGSWSVDGQDMLRAALDKSDPLQSASFPLVPYSNRIGFGRFDWNGRAVQLPPHPVATPHAIHGVGWTNAWQVAELEPDHARLVLHHDPDADWPWPFEAEQRVSIGDNWLHILMIARNRADMPVPLAFGHHPYFDSDGASIMFKAKHFYPSGTDMLPLEVEAVSERTDFSYGRTVAAQAFDNCFGGWDGAAQIEWVGRAKALTIESDMANAVLFTPAGSDFFCFEPVPHINNALCRADGDMPVIAAGESYTAHIRFTAIAA